MTHVWMNCKLSKWVFLFPDVASPLLAIRNEEDLADNDAVEEEGMNPPITMLM